MIPSHLDPTTGMPLDQASRAVRWTSTALLAVVWVSIAAFGASILATYLHQGLTGQGHRWNDGVLPGLFDPDRLMATLGIGLHFATGGVLMLLIPLQLIGSLRRRYPAVHRWSGRVSVSAALLAGIGGLAFILVKGTIGGTLMDIGFAFYGALIVLASINTFRHARARRWLQHRAWAIRLFALAIASWLYRVEYAGWSIATDGAGRTQTFDGPFDVFMAFFFYTGALVVAEAYLRSRGGRPGTLAVVLSTATLVVSTLVLAVLNYFLVRYSWGPGIVALFG